MSTFITDGGGIGTPRMRVIAALLTEKIGDRVDDVIEIRVSYADGSWSTRKIAPAGPVPDVASYFDHMWQQVGADIKAAMLEKLS